MLVSAPGFYLIQLTITSMDTAGPGDFVTIYDGPSSSSPSQAPLAQSHA